MPRSLSSPPKMPIPTCLVYKSRNPSRGTRYESTAVEYTTTFVLKTDCLTCSMGSPKALWIEWEALKDVSRSGFGESTGLITAADEFRDG